MRILAVLALVLGVAPAAHAQRYGDAIPGERYFFRGGWVLPPPGSGWKRQRARPPMDEIDFVRGTDLRHTWAGVAGTTYLDQAASHEGLSKLARLRAEAQGKSVTLRSFEATPDSTLAPLAVRYHYQVEDRKVPYDKGKLYVLDARGVLFVHPEASRLLVTLEFSERAESSIPLAEEATARAAADSFFVRAELVRIDTVAVRRGEVGLSPYRVQAARGSVWVVSHPRPEVGKKYKPTSEILRLDAASMVIQARAHVDGGVADIAETPEALWACDYEHGVLLRLDPSSLATTGTVKLGGNPERLLVTESAVWVSDRGRGTIQTVELGSLEKAREPIYRLKQPLKMWLARGLVWVTDYEANAVVSIDPQSRAQVGAPIPVGERPGAMVYGDSAIWVLCHGIRAVQRVDPASRAVTATVPLSFDANDIVFAGGALWVSDFNAGRLVKVDPGTSRVTSESVCAGLETGHMHASEQGVWIADPITGAIALMPLR